MQLQTRFRTAAVSLSFATLASSAGAALSGASDGRVTFVASGPAGMKIEGKTSDLSLVDQGDTIVITVALSNLTTGIALRDRHMKEKYLEVQKYPTATLSIARSALKLPPAGDPLEMDVPSTMNLHGKTRPVTVHFETRRDGATLSTHGQFHIDMTDFGISVPSYLGVTVKPDVGVSADFRVAGS